MLEGLEQKLSPLRRSSAKARRKTVWREICKREPAFFAKLLKTLDLSACVRACVCACVPFSRA